MRYRRRFRDQTPMWQIALSLFAWLLAAITAYAVMFKYVGILVGWMA